VNFNFQDLEASKSLLIEFLQSRGYRDLEEIGFGNFGIVLKAKNSQGQTRALKL
jgi:hypothetical protein